MFGSNINLSSMTSEDLFELQKYLDAAQGRATARVFTAGSLASVAKLATEELQELSFDPKEQVGAKLRAWGGVPHYHSYPGSSSIAELTLTADGWVVDSVRRAPTAHTRNVLRWFYPLEGKPVGLARVFERGQR